VTLLFDKLRAVVRRDLLTALRYRRAYWMMWLGIALELASFYYLARAVGPGFRPEGMDYYSFLLAGTALYTFLLLGVNAFVDAVHEAQASGTMEVLMSTSTTPAVTIGLSAISTVAGRLLHAVVYIALGAFLFAVPLPLPDPAATLAVLLLSTLLVVAIGILGAALQVWLQRGNALVWLLGAAGTLLTGAMFPVSALPDWLQAVARAIPLTYALSAFRTVLLQRGTLADVALPLGVLALYVAVLIPLSLAVFSFVIRNARRDGSLAWY